MPFAMHDVGSRAAFKGNASQRKKYDGGINDITAQQMRNGYGVGNNQKKVKKVSISPDFFIGYFFFENGRAGFLFYFQDKRE